MSLPTSLMLFDLCVLVLISTGDAVRSSTGGLVPASIWHWHDVGPVLCDISLTPWLPGHIVDMEQWVCISQRDNSSTLVWVHCMCSQYTTLVYSPLETFTGSFEMAPKMSLNFISLAISCLQCIPQNKSLLSKQWKAILCFVEYTVELREEQPQTAYPMSLTWTSHIGDTMLMGR